MTLMRWLADIGWTLFVVMLITAPGDWQLKVFGYLILAFVIALYVIQFVRLRTAAKEAEEAEVKATLRAKGY